MIIHSRAPLRLGLAGGGTDVSPYSETFGGSVLNATIDRYAYAELASAPEGSVQFVGLDQAKSLEISHDVPIDLSGDLKLHKAVYSKMMNLFNGGQRKSLKLSTFSDAPVGSGLGASSTLVVAMVKAFDAYFEAGLSKYEVARLAYDIERVDCGLAGGKQDQYSASFGGINFMEFEKDSVQVNPIELDPAIIYELEASLILFYTGVSRESASIISDQSDSVSSNESALMSMHNLKREAAQMKSHLVSGNFSGLVESMRMGWENKKNSARAVSNPHIDRIYETALDAGALAGKVSGAGGGGFMLFFTPVTNRFKVLEALTAFEGIASNCHFSNKGAHAWKAN